MIADPNPNILISSYLSSHKIIKFCIILHPIQLIIKANLRYSIKVERISQSFWFLHILILLIRVFVSPLLKGYRSISENYIDVLFYWRGLIEFLSINVCFVHAGTFCRIALIITKPITVKGNWNLWIVHIIFTGGVRFIFNIISNYTIRSKRLFDSNICILDIIGSIVVDVSV